MEQIEYFQVPEQVAFKRHTGRLVTAGVILLLTALLPGTGAALMTFALLRFGGQVRDEWLGIATILGGMISLAILFIYLGVGTLLRRRWCRPSVLAVAGIWLTMGTAFSMAMTVVYCQTAWRRMTYAGSYRSDFLEEFGMLGAMVTVTFLFPLTLVLLIKPNRIREALAMIDLKSRWTDTWSIGRLAFLAANTFLALVFGWFWADVFHSGWQSDLPAIGVMVPCVAVCALVAAVLTRWHYPVAWASGVLTAVAFLGTLACFVPDMKWSVDYRFEDNVMLLAGFAVGAAFLVFLIGVYPRTLPIAEAVGLP